ncbi:FtsX-like permease family protein [Actinokineospora spheciospongiae]|uniref:FtsX-like permease family protein n=1 Tax=Actinokineospora spheciospongiae TaxID=909613 RepID=UPI000D71272C|nr:FtsX-like permease family protein [Actinokineospora spheciospongiae]PWW64121.1 ABC-type lipoprotein release transport system permease subunit [Actinokineospora spheciospongiae]
MVRAWCNDLAIGVRLAVGGGRTSLARFLLSTFGVATAVAVLLLAASVQPTLQARDDRSTAASPDSNPAGGITPLAYRSTSTNFHGRNIAVRYVYAPDATSPVPPGMDAVPAEGSMWVSGDLATLLAEPGSGLLRDRFPARVAGVLGQEGVPDPHDLVAYVGAGPDLVGGSLTTPVYAFGTFEQVRYLDPTLLLLILLGIVALLVPVFIFLAASTRIAGAERDRRLSALRLVGAGDRQVRRIAAAESLVSAVAGLVVGVGLYQVGRSVAPGVVLAGISVYPSDIVPVWWLAALVVLAVPVLAVLTAQFALRRTIIEPLGVVRFSKPVNRKPAWRFAVIGFGVVLLLWHGGGARAGSEVWSYSVAAGATLLLAGVPILLPLVIERAVARLRGGPTSWQLAIRRLQLDSGTSARVVGGVAIVLAGAIAVQSVLVAQADRFADSPSEVSTTAGQSPHMQVYPEADAIQRSIDLLDGVPGVRGAFPSESVTFELEETGMTYGLNVLDCAVVTEVYRVPDCGGGQVYAVGGADFPELFTSGRTLRLMDVAPGGEYRPRAAWTIPEIRRVARPAESGSSLYGLFLTAGGTLPDPLPTTSRTTVDVVLDPTDPDALDRAHAALAPLGWKVHSNEFDPYYYGSRLVEEQSFLTIRRGLLIGAVFILLLAGISLLVLALEHIRERRRPLAVLAASGVPTGALARSLLWQIAVPIALGVLIAIGTGIALAALVLRLGNDPLYVDWPSVGLMTLAAAVLGLLVSVVTLPFLRGATRLTSLRTE